MSIKDDSGSISSDEGISSKKRKRQDREYNELEVDVSAPEPPSKKALRQAKKGKTVDAQHEDGEAQIRKEDASKRSEYGVWIGNLPWIAGKPELTKFILENTKLQLSDITRVHMPAPPKDKNRPSRQTPQPQNKGFAYVDFTTESACKAVIALSEKLLAGRRLLIKDAKSFDGRPEASQTKANPANERVFIGNLSFDTTEDDLRNNFSRCGDIVSTFMATFEDSGQCKGYAWITFKAVESAEKAVRGWTEWEQEESDTTEYDDSKKSSRKPRKWWINKLKGRSLRIEFAEGATVRYQKRFGKGKGQDEPANEASVSEQHDSGEKVSRPADKKSPKNSQSQGLRSGGRFQVDARTVAPGAALAQAPRQSAAILQGTGKKIMFD
ncbi:MAG: hypothetical protein GOMPHAMPRED_005685 [Gomphillus americanus]|uniref:RRM domain-containing protein n=1 Tax=Gomphillus americanus TaxID=1940652 RepID=A0A8H3FZZ5_9LECA|nr:MAG: hypothetical protein GOMPHAMPRED_005685 [Gomphillus americanus]